MKPSVCNFQNNSPFSWLSRGSDELIHFTQGKIKRHNRKDAHFQTDIEKTTTVYRVHSMVAANVLRVSTSCFCSRCLSSCTRPLSSLGLQLPRGRICVDAEENARMWGGGANGREDRITRTSIGMCARRVGWVGSPWEKHPLFTAA